MDNFWNGEQNQQINANSGMNVSVEGQTTTLDASGNAQPFAHLQRLGDKLIGGVLFAAEAAIDDAMNPADVAKPITYADGFLPQELASYINRNLGVVSVALLTLFAVLILAIGRR